MGVAPNSVAILTQVRMAHGSTRVVRGHTRSVITNGELREVTIEDAVPAEAPCSPHELNISVVGVRTARLLTTGKPFAWDLRLAISCRARVHFRRGVRYQCLIITAPLLCCVTLTQQSLPVYRRHRRVLRRTIGRSGAGNRNYLHR